MTAPEVQAAKAKLDGLHKDVVTDQLRDATLRAARVAVFHREAQQAASQFEADLAAALAALDVQGALAALSDIRAASDLTERLPSAEVDPVALGEALERASSLIDQAQQFAGRTPVPLCALETDAFRSLPVTLVQKVDAPVNAPGDRELEEACRAHDQTRTAIFRAVDEWRSARTTGAADAFALLANAAALAEQLRELGSDAARLGEQVDRANQERRDNRHEWHDPNGIETLELKRLRRFREQSEVLATA